jgi:hypothetical protein
MHELVIARYAEALDWITEVPECFAVHIFNKGAPVEGAAVRARAASITDRPNEGRESETYLHYIGTRAAAAGDPDGYTIFSQGDPFEHSPDFLALLRAIAQWRDLQPLSWRWKTKRDIPPSAILAGETGAFIDGLRIRPEIFSLQTWTPIGFHDVGTEWLQRTYRDVHGLPEGTNIAAHFLRMCDVGGLAAQAEGHLLGRFSYGAIFAVRRRLLERFPRDSLPLLRRASLGHEVYGYVLERLWLHLFGAGFILPVAMSAHRSPTIASGPVFVPPDPATPTRRLARRVRSLVSGLKL